MRRFWMIKGLAFIVLAPLLVAAVSFAVMMLWNALVPTLFAGPVVSFWQALGLLVLSRLLFGGLRSHGHRHNWRQRAWRSRWHRMSPEERDRFRDGFRRWKTMSREERREFRKGFGGGVCGGPFGACGPAMGGSRDPDVVDGSSRETSTSGREENTASHSRPAV